ncbi:MAG TPA: toll/interleukin-1 receptor domain-containing protein [Anaeromyxobacteraceae bacterium]|jgi:hypothetical protein
MKGKKAFLSHASQDRSFASRLAATLERHGVSVWYSADAVRGSQEWQNEIGRALGSCRWFLLLGTRAACRKPKGKPWWVRREVIYALGNRRYEGRIVPLLREKADLGRLSWFLPQIQYVDFRRDYDEGCRRLLQTWNKAYRK